MIKKIWNGLIKTINEFKYPEEMRKTARNFLDSKGRVQLNRSEETAYICAGAIMTCLGSEQGLPFGNGILFNPTHTRVFFNGKRVMGTSNGGGTHGEAPYKIFGTSENGKLKIVDGNPDQYKIRGNTPEKATIIFTEEIHGKPLIPIFNIGNTDKEKRK